MYRTGDRGLLRPDGEIEFRGRTDRQTQIRGQRVELDEIGSILCEHPSIEFGVAITKASELGESRIVAYVLPKRKFALPSSHELKDHLQRSLPDYMIPAIFVPLKALPLSPNGKLDLAFLERNSEAQTLEGPLVKAADTPIKAKLLAIMRELLGQEAVAVDDNFFLAGGHSLLGMQLVMLVRKAFGVEITLRELFEAPTVEGLAALVETRLNEDRLAVIWEDLTGRKKIDPDESLVDMRSSPELLAALQQRIATQFGRYIPISELSDAPTIRKQAELTLEVMKAKPVLPPGVLELQPNGNRETIFWAHYQSVNLAKAIGSDHPFLSVTLTAEDIAKLGPVPDMHEIAACHMRKILATQPKGPYVIGGQCIGGVLAYEIACEMRAAGHDVSLLVLLDSRNPSSQNSCDSTRSMLRYMRYLVARATQIGPRLSLVYLREHLRKGYDQLIGDEASGQVIKKAHSLVSAWAAAYRPGKYDGKVLLLLAADRPPHVDLLRGWKALTSGNLTTCYVDSHHRNLLDKQHAKTVANLIVSHLAHVPVDSPVRDDSGAVTAQSY
jgi:thioesterase domain-containing protein/acyl carrier protein